METQAKRKIPLVPQEEVEEFVRTNFPQLAPGMVRIKDWCWLSCNLQGEANKETRERLKEFGFRFRFKGPRIHEGKELRWSHHCEHATSFRRGKRNGKEAETGPVQPEKPTATQSNPLDDEIRALLELV